MLQLLLDRPGLAANGEPAPAPAPAIVAPPSLLPQAAPAASSSWEASAYGDSGQLSVTMPACCSAAMQVRKISYLHREGARSDTRR